MLTAGPPGGEGLPGTSGGIQSLSTLNKLISESCHLNIISNRSKPLAGPPHPLGTSALEPPATDVGGPDRPQPSVFPTLELAQGPHPTLAPACPRGAKRCCLGAGHVSKRECRFLPPKGRAASVSLGPTARGGCPLGSVPATPEADPEGEAASGGGATGGTVRPSFPPLPQGSPRRRRAGSGPRGRAGLPRKCPSGERGQQERVLTGQPPPRAGREVPVREFAARERSSGALGFLSGVRARPGCPDGSPRPGPPHHASPGPGRDWRGTAGRCCRLASRGAGTGPLTTSKRCSDAASHQSPAPRLAPAPQRRNTRDPSQRETETGKRVSGKQEEANSAETLSIIERRDGNEFFFKGLEERHVAVFK